MQTAQHTHSSQSVVMTAVVSANTDGAASALQCRLCSFVSGLVTKNGSELTPSSLTSQHFMTFSQFYIISDRSVEVAPSRISSIHSTVEFSLGRGSFNYKGLVSVICSNYTHYYTPTLYKCYDNGVEGRVVNTI